MRDKSIKAEYDMQYMKKNVVRKLLSFNRNKPEDMAIFEWLCQQQNMSEYIKNLIRKDMQKG